MISVSDKLGLVEFASGLVDAGVEIFSTGGTRRHLESNSIKVRDVSEYTEFPEMMDGRLKTLHPKIFGGILCRHDRADDMDAIGEHGIATFELVVVNLYPFEATVARPEVTLAEAIEQIDIGGPSLVRAAAKNHAFVSIVTDPQQYAEVFEQISDNGCTTAELRQTLSLQAFLRTASYDRAISDYLLGATDDSQFLATLNLQFQKKADLRYGENPHQTAAVYADKSALGANLVSARQLNGKELSYNNLLDLDSALAMVRSFAQPACTVIKHNNPCGAAVNRELHQAARMAMAGDPLSAFGSVLGFNRTVDVETAEVLVDRKDLSTFIEAIVAPDFDVEAIDILTSVPKWKNNVRLLQVGSLDTPRAQTNLRMVEGGVLAQQADIDVSPESDWKVVSESEPDDQQMAELRFAWEMVRHVKSNAIVLSRDQALIGVGAGQMSRVDSVNIAINKGGDRVAGSVLASDAFFPFPDSIHVAAKAGIRAVIQPGGSRRDDEVIAACNEHKVSMIFTGSRHFKH